MRHGSGMDLKRKGPRLSAQHGAAVRLRWRCTGSRRPLAARSRSRPASGVPQPRAPAAAAAPPTPHPVVGKINAAVS